ncbi:hypothetical protein AJ79_07104 [Helicocarpus griseus UAMH5409]|uniref:Uncharacterized protein n=1 Tax=Helicocarpus griseus UAMH5409 TaxID=1447875 RepID=A0A2B7WY90_9EURO|nr:hypothetical protein AJ79_07104 [Helicocarpus griseus UAMH5409]
MGFKAFLSMLRGATSSSHHSANLPDDLPNPSHTTTAFRTCQRGLNKPSTRNTGALTSPQGTQQSKHGAIYAQETFIVENDHDPVSKKQEQKPSVKEAQHPEILEDVSKIPSPSFRASARDWERLGQLFQKVMPKLDRVSEERFEARCQRFELKDKREQLLDTGAELIQTLNGLFAEASPNLMKPLVDLFERYKQEQDAYLSLEDDFREFENHLILKEYQLEKIQEKLNKAFHRTENPSEGDISTHTDDLDDTSSSSGASAALSEDKTLHPLVAQYLSLLGEHSLVGEELFNMRSKYRALMAEKTARRDFESILDDESEAFLRDFKSLEKGLLDERDRIDESAHRTKQECKYQGLLLPDGNGDNSSSLEDLLLEPATEMRNNPYLEPKIEEQSRVFTEPNSVLSHEPLNIVEYINKWLLHQLRLSPFQMNRFRTATGFDMEQVDEQKFREWWFNDETATQHMTPPRSIGNNEYLKPPSVASSGPEFTLDEPLNGGSRSSFNQNTEPQSYFQTPKYLQRDSGKTSVPDHLPDVHID